LKRRRQGRAQPRDRPAARPRRAGRRRELRGSLFQTDLEGNSRLYSVGRYRVEAVLRDGGARLKSVQAIADTGTVPSLLATPI